MSDDDGHGPAMVTGATAAATMTLVRSSGDEVGEGRADDDGVTAATATSR